MKINLRKSAKGFSLIELLVAVLVMGIGVLGITGLQMVSLQNNRGALVRSEAVQLAYDMMDRIRANPAGTPAGNSYNGLAVGATPPAFTDCIANNCTQAQMVTFDQAMWKCALGTHNDHANCLLLRDGSKMPLATEQPGLPEGDGSIVVDNGTGVISVTVQWQEPNSPLRTITLDSQG